MADRVKELFEVKVYAVLISAVDDFLRLSQCLVRAPSRSEAVACLRELRFVHQAQYLGYGLLDDAVNHGGYAELARLASLFGYLYPPYGIRAVAFAKQTFGYFILVSTQIRKQLLYFHSVDSSAPLVGLDLSVRSVKVVGSQDIL